MKLKYCVACGEEDAAKLEHHHLVPRIAGGSDDPTNLITLCHTCHGKAHGYERRHVRALTVAGIARAKPNGKKSGNPRMRTRDPEMLRELSRKQTEIQLLRLMKKADVFLPIVQQMRPFEAWNDIAKTINTKTGSEEWNGNTLRHAVQRLVSKGLADPALVEKIPAEEIHFLRMIKTADVWLPIVQQMRPFTVWNDIAKAINTTTGSIGWEGKTVRRAVSHLALIPPYSKSLRGSCLKSKRLQLLL
jgi:hypothetical protein